MASLMNGTLIRNDSWENCAGFTFYQIRHTDMMGINASNTNHIIDVLRQKHKNAVNGQEHNATCVDACAYYRLHNDRTVEYIKHCVAISTPTRPSM